MKRIMLDTTDEAIQRRWKIALKKLRRQADQQIASDVLEVLYPYLQLLQQQGDVT